MAQKGAESQYIQVYLGMTPMRRVLIQYSGMNYVIHTTLRSTRNPFPGGSASSYSHL